jgi:uncharacterized protein HemY
VEAMSTTFMELFAQQMARNLEDETIKNRYLNDVLEKMFDDGIGVHCTAHLISRQECAAPKAQMD